MPNAPSSSRLNDDHNDDCNISDQNSLYEKLVCARRSHKLAQVSLNLQDRLGLAKLRYEQRYSKYSSTKEKSLNLDSVEHVTQKPQSSASSSSSSSSSSSTATSISTSAPTPAIGARITVPRSFSSPLKQASYDHNAHPDTAAPKYNQSRHAAMVDSAALRDLTVADDLYSPPTAAAASSSSSEDRSRGPLLYSDPFRHAKEEPISNPWNQRWNFSATTTQMAGGPALPLSSPTDARYLGRRHQGNVAVGGGGGRRQAYDYPDSYSRCFRGHDSASLFVGDSVVNQMNKHDPMLPSVPSFGLDSESRRFSSSLMNHHNNQPSPCTPPPKRQRTIPIRQGKPYAGDTSSESIHGQHPLQENNEVDLLLYLANSPQAGPPPSSSSSSGGGGGGRAKNAPSSSSSSSYVHSFSANYSYPGLHNFSDIPSTPPSRHTGYPPSSSLLSTPLPSSSTIPITPLSRLTNNCSSNTPFNFADYVNVTPSPAQTQKAPLSASRQQQQQQQQQEQSLISPSAGPAHRRQRSIQEGARFYDKANCDINEPSPLKAYGSRNILTPGPPLYTLEARRAKMEALGNVFGHESDVNSWDLAA